MTTTHDEKRDDAAPHAGEAARGFAKRHRADPPTRFSIGADELHALLQARTTEKSNLPAWGAAVGATIAVIFSVMGYLNSTTQDKVDKGTAPLNIQISELDKRVTGRLDSLDRNVEKISTRMDGVETRLSNIEMRLERIDSKLK